MVILILSEVFLEPVSTEPLHIHVIISLSKNWKGDSKYHPTGPVMETQR